MGNQDKVGTLQIEFNHGGIYNYDFVPKEVFEDLLAADSIGKAFHATIKGQYPYQKLEEEQEQETDEPWSLDREIADGDRNEERAVHKDELPDHLL